VGYNEIETKRLSRNYAVQATEVQRIKMKHFSGNVQLTLALRCGLAPSARRIFTIAVWPLIEALNRAE
jgi:hypothetical protein